MDKKDAMLIQNLKRYKALHHLTNEDIGGMIIMHKTAVSKLFTLTYPMSESIRIRIEELLKAWESEPVVSYKSQEKSHNSNIQQHKPAKISINAEVKKKLVNKIAHKSPKMRSR